MLKKSISLITAASFALSGCASIISKSNYPVSITSSPSEAKFTVTDQKGVVVHKGETPSTITLKSGSGFFKGADYTIKYSKDGYEPSTAFITPKVDGWYVANIVFGGLIGLLIVDPLTGAMYKLPDVNNTALEKTNKTSLDSTGERKVKVVSIEELTQEQRARLVRIN